MAVPPQVQRQNRMRSKSVRGRRYRPEPAGRAGRGGTIRAGPAPARARRSSPAARGGRCAGRCQFVAQAGQRSTVEVAVRTLQAIEPRRVLPASSVPARIARRAAQRCRVAGRRAPPGAGKAVTTMVGCRRRRVVRGIALVVVMRRNRPCGGRRRRTRGRPHSCRPVRILGGLAVDGSQAGGDEHQQRHQQHAALAHHCSPAAASRRPAAHSQPRIERHHRGQDARGPAAGRSRCPKWRSMCWPPRTGRPRSPGPGGWRSG